MKVTKLFLLLVCLLELSSCDGSIMGSFLNWCWVDNRQVTICYGRSGVGACGVKSEVSSVVSVNATGYYGAASNVPIGANSANQTLCSNQLITCQNTLAAASYKGIEFTMPNSSYNYSESGTYTPLNCAAGINPFIAANNCNQPTTDNSTPNPPVCNDDDSALFTRYCDAYMGKLETCTASYQSCITASAPAIPANPVYGQWVSSNLQIDSMQSVRVDPSKTTGSITLTQPLGLRQSGSPNSFASLLQAYQAKIQKCAGVDVLDPSSPSYNPDCVCDLKTPLTATASDFCVLQYCENYNQSLGAGDSGYQAACDCSASARSASLSDFCTYGLASTGGGDSVMAGYSDFANNGKGVLVPFYFDQVVNTQTYALKDPTNEKVYTISGSNMANAGYGTSKQLTDANGNILYLLPNQILTFTVDHCGSSNDNLDSPYSTTLPFPYGTLSGWTFAAGQLMESQETFTLPNSSTQLPTITYKYRSLPQPGGQCSNSCAAAAGGGSAPGVTLTSAGGVYRNQQSYLNDSQGCWNVNAENINFTIGAGSPVALSSLLKNGSATHTYTYNPQTAGKDGLFFSFSVPQVSSTTDDVNSLQDSMNQNLCMMLANLPTEKGLTQPANLDLGTCQADPTVYGLGGSNGNGQRCYPVITGYNDSSLIVNKLRGYTIIRSTNIKDQQSGHDDKHEPEFFALNLYCTQSQLNALDADNCIDGAGLNNQNASGIINACENNSGTLILRGYLGYSCCYKYGTNPNVNVEENIKQALAIVSGTNGTSIPGALRVSEIAGIVDAKIQDDDPTQFVYGDAVNPVSWNFEAGTKDSCSPFMLGSGGEWAKYNISTYANVEAGCGDVWDLSNAYIVSSYMFTRPNISFPTYSFKYDDSIYNRSSLNARRVCFPYDTDCPSGLGFVNSTPETCSHLAANNQVVQTCNYSRYAGNNHNKTACCYRDNMGLTGDQYPHFAKLFYQRLGYANQINNATTQAAAGTGTKAATAADIVGGVNVYVKSMPVFYSSGQYLQMTISHDDPNQLANPPTASTFVDALNTNLPCNANSPSCVPKTSVCTQGGSCSQADPDGVGTVWLRIVDDPNQNGDGIYTNNTGAYNVYLEVMQQSSPSPGSSNGGLFGDILTVIRSTLSSSLGNIYNVFTNNGEFATYISFVCEIYIIITAFYYILGITKYNQLEFIIKIIKLCIVASVTKPEFESYMLNELPAAVFEGQSYLIASATGSAAGTGGDFNPFYMFEQVFDFFISDMGTLYRWIGMFGMGGGGTILASLILICCFYYIFAIIDGLKAYLMAVMSIALMFAMAPLMISFLLFSKTREIFDNWWKHILQYMLEPVLLFTGLSILSTLVLSQLYPVFSDGVCLKCVLNFIVGIGSASPFSNLMDLCIPGLLPHGFDNQGNGLIALYFTHFGEGAILLILAMILKNYNKFIQNIALQIVMAGGRSVTGMTSYNNLVDGGSSGGGSLESFQKLTGLNKESMMGRRQAGLKQAMATFKGGEAKPSEEGADIARKGSPASDQGGAPQDLGGNVDLTQTRNSVPAQESGNGIRPISQRDPNQGQENDEGQRRS